MSLNGNLEVFPLEEVLRLLSRSKKNGCLRVETDGIEGRVYIEDGRIVYATTRQDEDLRVDLLNAGLVSEADWVAVESREKAVVDVLSDDVDQDQLVDFLREHVVEVLFRLARARRGTFDFGPDVSPTYTPGRTLDVELCLAESDRRIAQWAEIEEVIPGMNFRLKIAATLPGDREITISPDTWKLLAALGGEGAVNDLSENMGMSEFQVAKAMATLVRAQLVEVADDVRGKRYGYGQKLEHEEPADHIVSRPLPVLDDDSGGSDAEGISEHADGQATKVAPADGNSHLDETREPPQEDDSSFLQDVLAQVNETGDDSGDSDDGDSGDNGTDDSGKDDQPVGLLRRRGITLLAKELRDSED